jgi:two-component system chemotaxis response regulator CheB
MRILIADDSSVTRRIVSEALNMEVDMEIVATAQDGEEAIAYFKAQRPDVVLLDVDMPTISGIEALKAIRALNDSVPVIMFSTLTVKGGEATLDALAAGATDYAPKPTGAGHLDKALAYLKQEVVPKVRLWGNRYKMRQEKSAQMAPSVKPNKEITVSSAATAGPARGSSSFTVASSKPIVTAPTARKRSGPVSILAIGASTGGPNALAELISLLPGDLGVPVVIVQHMPPVFTQLLAERLDRTSRLTVKEGYDGAVLRAGEAWVAPGDFHMVVSREGTETLLRTNKNTPENSCRPAVDVLFRSVAEVYGGNTLAVVLTGMGRDGTAGCQVLSKVGAGILVQDEASSVVWGMPRSVAEAGLADSVLNLKDIAAAITTRIRGSHSSASSLASGRV